MDKMAAMNFTKENHIEAVMRFPCLYDTTMKEYKDDLIWENAWKLICIKLNGKEYDDNELHANGKGTIYVSYGNCHIMPRSSGGTSIESLR